MRTREDILKRIAVLLAALLVMMSFAACGSGSDGGPHVRMVTDAVHSTYGTTYGDAFDKFFDDPKWEYFKSANAQDVVEFNGEFSYNGCSAIATIQFLIDPDEGTFTAYQLFIDGEVQSRLMLVSMLQNIFESY